ncbi:MAG: hypothetical protein ACE5IZ_04665 [Dehalococcoidia bacterium]
MAVGKAGLLALAVLLLGSLPALLWGFPGLRRSLGLATDSAQITDNAFTTDALDPPTGLTAASSGTNIDLSWTATVDTYASGHRVLRGTASGGPYTQIAQVTPRTTTSYVDSPAAGTYYYVVRAFYQSWESVNSNEASASISAPTSTGFQSPTAQAADSGGDGDGYEDSPTDAFADDGNEARDRDSGTSNSTSCTDSGKDRHRFYNYGFSIPGGSAINGIEVRLVARVNDTAGAPKICAQLSWDGGSTWTAAKTTPTLSTDRATYTLGSASDGWGRAWSASELANSSFRVRVIDVASDTNTRFRLDWIAVQATYTPP